MISFITFFCFALIGYIYFGYPVLLAILPIKNLRSPSDKTTKPIKKVSIIVAARNEEQFIGDRLENLLATDLAVKTDSSALDSGDVNQHNLEREIIVCSDASTDQTDLLVQQYADRGVKLVRSTERRGKEYAQQIAVKESSGEILVFTDAKVTTSVDLIVKLLRYFEDLTVGAVSSVDRVSGSEDGSPEQEESSSEGIYVRYEMWLRELESKYFSLVGLSGSCFAVRREVAMQLRNDVPSDFFLLLETVRLGMRGVSATDVVCSYRAVRSEEEEFRRKVRTVLRGITAFFAVKDDSDLQANRVFVWQILSHKLGRWLVPWLLLMGTLGAWELSEDSLLWGLIVSSLILFYLFAALGFFAKKLRKNLWFKVPLFFITTNLAILIAWIKYFRGDRAIIWDPSVR